MNGIIFITWVSVWAGCWYGVVQAAKARGLRSWQGHLSGGLAGILISLIVLVQLLPNTPEETAAQKTPEETAAQRKEAASLHGERKAFIQKLINVGVFQKVEVEMPRLWVRPAFYDLDFDTKSKFVNVVWGYYLAENPERIKELLSVDLYDSQTGKKVGEYAEVYGGLKLK